MVESDNDSGKIIKNEENDKKENSKNDETIQENYVINNELRPEGDFQWSNSGQTSEKEEIFPSIFGNFDKRKHEQELPKTKRCKLEKIEQTIRKDEGNKDRASEKELRKETESLKRKTKIAYLQEKIASFKRELEGLLAEEMVHCVDKVEHRRRGKEKKKVKTIRSRQPSTSKSVWGGKWEVGQKDNYYIEMRKRAATKKRSSEGTKHKEV